MQANGIFRRLVGTAYRLDYKYKIAGGAFDYMAFDSAVGRFVDSIFERKKEMFKNERDSNYFEVTAPFAFSPYLSQSD